MSVFDKLNTLDRRWIFLFISLAVLLPMLVHLQCAQIPSPMVRGIFDKIESLPPGSRVLLSFDYGPSLSPEVQPMVDAIIRHCLERRLKLCMMALWATGQNIMTSTIDDVIKAEYPNLVYGTDYVNFGYKAGNQGVINVIVTDYKKMFPADAQGTPATNIPMMQGVRSLKNMDLIVSFGGGFPGIKEWVLFAGDLANVPVAGGCTAVAAPLLYPYYPRQLIGLMGGIKAAAEYEAALGSKYPRFNSIRMRGSEMMGPQTVAHVVIMIFIIIGNAAYFMTRGKEEPRLRVHGE